MRPTRKKMKLAEFEELVRQAAAKRPKRTKRATPASNIAHLRPGRIKELRLRAPQCQQIKADGHRCNGRAMRGAKRCNMHGGAFDVPDHPANIKKLEEGHFAELLVRESQRREFYAHDRETREHVKGVYLKAMEGRCPARGQFYTQLNIGAQAFNADDGGLAYRRWVKSLHLSTKPA